MCLSGAYLIPDLWYQRLDNLRNNSARIYIVATHVGNIDIWK